MIRSRGSVSPKWAVLLVSGLMAIMVWMSMGQPVHAYTVDCPQPISGTCFPRHAYGIEVDPDEPTEFPDIHFIVYNSTYVYNVEAQGTFVPRKACQGFFCPQGKEEVNGFTLFGDFVALQVRSVPARNVRLYGGVFFAVPFGGKRTIDDVRPIFSLGYSPIEGVNFIAGTLQPRHLFFDAIFDDLMYFIRPVEQGFQLLADTPYYQHDLFINWQQANTKINNERFDLGYVGKLKFGPLRVNGQLHWDHHGGEIPFPDFRPLQARNNFVWAAGPELSLSPAAYVSWLSWWRMIGVGFTFMGSKDEPNTRTPALTTKGHARELRGWVDIKGWLLAAARWNSDNFVASHGDRFYGVRKMTEVSISTHIPIVREFSLELGGLVRFIDGQSGTPPSVQYAAVHWNMDFNLGRLFRDTQ